MSTECERVKQRLREQFDAGEDITVAPDAHANTCEHCRAYLQRLRAMELSFASLPIEAPAPDLVKRIQERLETESANTKRTKRGLAGALVAAFAVSVALGWFFPLSADLDALARAIQFQSSAWDGAATLAAVQDGLRLTWDNLAAPLGLLAGLPTVALWTGLVVSILALAAFNVMEAASVRNHSERAPRGYRIAK